MMTMSHRFLGLLLLGLTTSMNVHAAALLAFEETGTGDITGTLSGSIDLSGLLVTSMPQVTGGAFLRPYTGRIVTNGFAGEIINRFEFASGPTPFAVDSNLTTDVSVDSSTALRLLITPTFMYVPKTYSSGDPLSGVMTILGGTFDGLNMAQGTYVHTLPNNETVTVTIGSAAVPIPAAIWLFVSSLGFLGWRETRRRRLFL